MDTKDIFGLITDKSTSLEQDLALEENANMNRYDFSFFTDDVKYIIYLVMIILGVLGVVWVFSSSLGNTDAIEEKLNISVLPEITNVARHVVPVSDNYRYAVHD